MSPGRPGFTITRMIALASLVAVDSAIYAGIDRRKDPPHRGPDVAVATVVLAMLHVPGALAFARFRSLRSVRHDPACDGDSAEAGPDIALVIAAIIVVNVVTSVIYCLIEPPS